MNEIICLMNRWSTRRNREPLKQAIGSDGCRYAGFGRILSRIRHNSDVHYFINPLIRASLSPTASGMWKFAVPWISSMYHKA